MVDDPDNFCLLQPGNCLAQLVMVNEHHLFPARTDQMIAGQSTDDFFLLIKDWIGAEPALKDSFTDIVKIVREVEILNVFCTGDSADRNGLENEPGRAVCVKGAGDDTGGGRQVPVLFRQRGRAEDQTGSAGFNGKVSSVLLIAAQDNGSWTDSAQISGKRNEYFTGELIKTVRLRIDDMTFQGTEQVIYRHRRNERFRDGIHIVFRHCPRGDHSVQTTFVVNDRQAGNAAVAVRMDQPPCI